MGGNAGDGTSTTTNTEVACVVWLDTPFHEKDDAKARGAKWDDDKKKWFAPPDADLAKLQRWNPAARVYLRCPFTQKDDAKRLGARWDRDKNAWFVTPDMDPAPFAQWLP